MNWLAHVFLSQNHIEHQLGNLLTDPLKARAWEGASDLVKSGIETHKRIDAFTDSHAIVSKSKARLAKRGPLKGVVLDVLYDYYLSLHWEKFANVERVHFLETFRSEAPQAIVGYPDRAQEVIARVVINRQLSSYITMDGVESAFGRIDNRLSERTRSKDTTTRYLPIIDKENIYLEKAFLDFFPELMEEIAKDLPNDTIRHWRIDNAT